MAHPEFSFAARYLRAAAEKRGWAVTLHPDGNFAGQIHLPDGTVRHFVRSTYDLNMAGAAHVARDKGLTKFYLRRLGYPVLDGGAFFSDRLCQQIGSSRNAAAAIRYASEIGFPVMVKANSGSGGEGIERVAEPGEMEDALARAFAVDDVVLVEPYVAGLRDYRLLVLDGELLLAYERRPFALSGDGTSTIQELVREVVDKARERRTGSPDRGRLELELRRLGKTWSEVVPAGESLRLLDVANLSQGGTAEEVTEGVHPDHARLAVSSARDLGLRFCGVDLLAADIADPGGQKWILELNSSPTIHQFAALCNVSEERLMTFHERLLDAMVER